MNIIPYYFPRSAYSTCRTGVREIGTSARGYQGSGDTGRVLGARLGYRGGAVRGHLLTQVSHYCGLYTYTTVSLSIALHIDLYGCIYNIYMYIYIGVYIYTYAHTHICIYIYIYIYAFI